MIDLRPVLAALCLGAAACARPSATLSDRLPYAFEARTTWGEVRVVPAVDLHAPVSVNLQSYLGRALPTHRQRVRRERTRQLDRVPNALGLALPGEVNGLLGLRWAGQFQGHDLPSATEVRLRHALTGRRPDLTAVLAAGAKDVGGEATLFSWVKELSGEPLSLQGFPGEVVETRVGPIVLDHEEEPYLVEAEVGMALVTEDGEVVLRYQDTFHALLSGRTGTSEAARTLAHSLAEELSLVWATDPQMGAPPKDSRLRRSRTRWLPEAGPLSLHASDP